MGKLLKISKLTTLFEVVIVSVLLLGIGGGVYWYSPGLRVDGSKQLTGLQINKDNINNITTGVMIAIPSEWPGTNFRAVDDNLKCCGRWPRYSLRTDFSLVPGQIRAGSLPVAPPSLRDPGNK